jgi:hypothetical protein
MPLVTRDELVTITREVMDAQDSTRWGESEVVRALNAAFDQEWSNILNAAPHYTLGTRVVTSDAQGRIPFISLNDGTGDAEENFYRILSMTDGMRLYAETRFESVPLGLVTNYAPQYPNMYYMAGSHVQLLPGVAQQVTVTVNYKPTALSDLSTGQVPVTFPQNNELLLAYAAGAKLLNKGGTESVPARQLDALAADERQSLLDDLRRRTINPTRMAYPDGASDWAGMY